MATATQQVNRRPGSIAKVRMIRMSASKARVVLNLIRGKRVTEAAEILAFTERLAADPIGKCLQSAVANAAHNEDLSADELFISACFADEGPTLKRFRPRARGRAGRIHKQTCHITIEVSRFTDDELDEARKRNELKDEGRQKRSSTKGSAGGDRARRVARSRAAAGDDAPAEASEAAETIDDETVTAEAEVETTEATEVEEAVEATADGSDEAADDASEAPAEDATEETADADSEGDEEK